MTNIDTENDAEQIGGFRDPGGYFVPVMKTPVSEGIGLSEVWEKLVKYWKLLMLVTVAGTLLAVTAAFLMQPVYKSEVVMAPVSKSESNSGLLSMVQGLSGLASLAGVNVNRSSNKDEAIAIIKSRAFAESFIRDKNLLPKLFSSEWNAKEQQWKESDNVPTMQDAVTLFSEDIRMVSEDKRTGLVVLTIFWRDREEAADWATELVERLNLQMRERAIAEAEASINYLNEELEKAGSLELRQAIYELIENQIKIRMLGHIQKEYAFRVIDPATVSDADKFEKPKRAVIVALGFLTSATIGIFIALFVSSFRGRETADEHQ